MLQVVRLQHRENGVGIFTNNTFDNKLLTFPNEERQMYLELNRRHDDFNTPIEDKLDIHLDDKEWFCAYKTVEQLQKWLMSDEIRFLISKGFDVLLLNVGEYQVGEHQVVFTRESVKESTVINSLFI